MEGIRSASIKKIIFRDYASFFVSLFSLISLVGLVSIPLLIISIPLLIRRVHRIRNTVEEGMLVSGTVDKINSSQSTRTIWYTYRAQGETYRTKNWIMYYANKFKLNDSIEIAYSMDDPSVAFPISLYVADYPAC